MPGFSSQRVAIEVLGDDIVQRLLVQTGDQGADVSSAWDAVLGHMVGMIEEQFQEEGGRGSIPWQHLSPDWEAYKRRHGYNPAILKMTDDMFREITSPGDPMMIFEPMTDRMRFGSRNWKFAVHQEGSEVAGIPARPMLVFMREDVNVVSSILLEHVLSAWGGTGRRPFFTPPQGVRGRFLPGYVV